MMDARTGTIVLRLVMQVPKYPPRSAAHCSVCDKRTAGAWRKLPDGARVICPRKHGCAGDNLPAVMVPTDA